MSFSRYHARLLAALLAAPSLLAAQGSLPVGDDVTITRLGYRATKASASLATYAVGREIGMSRPAAAITGAALPVVVSKAIYLAQGSPGGTWPTAGFALKDMASEIAEGSAPLFMVWARAGGRKQWWRWPLATVAYGTVVYATWEWGAP